MLLKEMCVPIEKLNVPLTSAAQSRKQFRRALPSHHLTMKAFATDILRINDQRAFKVELGLFGGQLCSFQIEWGLGITRASCRHE